MSNTDPRPVPGRARRAVSAVAKAVGLCATFALAAAGGAVLHLGLPAPRRFVVARVNGILDGTFTGRVVITELGGVSLGGVRGVSVDVFDPAGQLVLAARGVDVRLGTKTLVRSLLGGGDVVIELPTAAIHDVDVLLEPDARGDLGLAHAFDSPAPSAPGGSVTVVRIGRVDVGHARVHGVVAEGAPRVDVSLDAVRGSVDSDAKGVRLGLVTATLDAHGLEGEIRAAS